jgi:hypothetical protein
MDLPYYMPLLRWGTGEKKALGELCTRDRRLVTPILRLQRARFKRGIRDGERALLDEYADLPRQFGTFWGSSLFFLDLSDWPPEYMASREPHPLKTLVRAAVAANLNSAPAMVLGCSPAY